jgi:hypothetical protein
MAVHKAHLLRCTPQPLLRRTIEVRLSRASSGALHTDFMTGLLLVQSA